MKANLCKEGMQLAEPRAATQPRPSAEVVPCPTGIGLNGHQRYRRRAILVAVD